MESARSIRRGAQGSLSTQEIRDIELNILEAVHAYAGRREMTLAGMIARAMSRAARSGIAGASRGRNMDFPDSQPSTFDGPA